MEYDADLHRSWEEQIIDVSCSADYCGSVARGTEEELEKRFWQIGNYSRFCPTHAAKRIMRRAA